MLFTISLAGQTAARKINILVYPFVNTGTAHYSWISAGMTQSVISDLLKISSVAVFSEEDRKRAVREIELGMTGLIRESDVAQVGQIMGAELICSGNFTVSGGKIRVNAKLVSVGEAVVRKAVTLDGSVDKIFELQDRIVTELMAAAGEAAPPGAKKPVFTARDRETIRKLPRPDIRAFELYAKGVELYETNPSGALTFFNQALSLEKDYYHALLAAGGAYSLLGKSDEADKYYAEAFDMLRKAGLDNSVEAASLYYSMGINFWNRGDSNRTIIYSQNAYKILESMGEQDSRQAASVLMLLGGGYRYANRVTDALTCTERSIAIYDRLGLRNTSDYAWGLNNLAVVYSMTGNRVKPIALYKQCLKIWSSLKLSVSMGTAYTYCQLGYEHYMRKEYEKAYDYLFNGRDLCIYLKLDNSFNFAYYTWYLSSVYSDGFGDHCIAAEFMKKPVLLFEKQKNPALSDAKNRLIMLEEKCAERRAIREKEERLISAAAKADTATVRKMIAEKVNINARAYNKGESALYNAAYKGSLEIVKLLVESGADVNIRMYRGTTPLMASIFKGRYDIIRYLLSKNASVNMANCRGETPLMDAVMWTPRKEIIEMLIEKGADVNARDDNGESVLHKATTGAKKLLQKHGAR